MAPQVPIGAYVPARFSGPVTSHSRGPHDHLKAPTFMRPHPNSPTNSTSGCLVNKAHAIAAQELSLQGDNEWLAANRCRKCRRPFRRTLCGTFPIVVRIVPISFALRACFLECYHRGRISRSSIITLHWTTGCDSQMLKVIRNERR